MECVKCLIPLEHPFGVYFNKDGICSGCLSFEKRKNDLPHWDNSELINDIGKMLSKEIGFLPEHVIVPFDADGETWFILDVLERLGIRATVVYFNAQYHDSIFYDILAACQENFDVDFIGFSLPHDLITWCLGEELATGNGHLRNLEIYGRHVSALFVANELGFRNIICGPNQQSEIVGSHYFIHKNQLSGPAFGDIVIGCDLQHHVKVSIAKLGSKFAKSFQSNFISSTLNKISWHFLSDYIFWDSENINNYYGNKFDVAPRNVNGFGSCWQSSSSGIKLEFFDLLRLILTGHSKIESYLSRDIRFGRVNKISALMILDRYKKKKWNLGGIAAFMNIHIDEVVHSIELISKSRGNFYSTSSFSEESNYIQANYSQVYYPR